LASTKVKDTCGCLEIDVLRVSTNFKYFIRQLAILPEEEWLSSASAMVNHHFDIHDSCGAFCKHKEKSKETRKALNKFYHDKEKNSELYRALTDVLSKYTTTECLWEVAHEYDTNPNESMNDLILWITPKNKCCLGSMSLTTRIAAVMCIQTLSFKAFFGQLFQRLGIVMTQGTRYWLGQKDKPHEKNKEKAKELTTKKRSMTS
jgi:hypothetical protein